MRHLKFTLLAIFMVLGSIGIVFAVFNFSEGLDKEVSVLFRLAPYEVEGTITYEFFKNSNEPVDALQLPSDEDSAEGYIITVKIYHTLPADVAKSVFNYIETVINFNFDSTVINEKYDVLIEGTPEWIEFDDYTQVGTYNIRFSPKIPFTLETWMAFKADLNAAMDNDTANIVLAVQIPYNEEGV